jgi:hypothetical protein
MVIKSQMPITLEEIERLEKELAMPIDFEALINTGVLEKRGAWYRIINKSKLPSHVSAKMYKAKTDGKETLVQFRKPSKRLAKKYGL